MGNLINASAFALIGALILIQTDSDGSLLINGWHGLGAACLACFAIAIGNVGIAIGRANQKGN